MNAHKVKADIGVIAGNTMLSMPERLDCEVLQKQHYIYTLTFPLFTYESINSTHSSSYQPSSVVICQAIIELFCIQV